MRVGVVDVNKKNTLLLTSFITVVLAVVFFRFYIETFNNTVITYPSRLGELKYSGKEEGEIINVEPRYPEGVSGIPIPPFKRYSLLRGLEEFSKKYGRLPRLPAWLPQYIKYASVYMGPVAIFCFSDEPEKDFRFGKVIIEVSYASGEPSFQELREEVEDNPRLKLLKIDDTWIILCEKAYVGDLDVEEKFGVETIPLAWFFRNGFYYSIAVNPPLTSQDLIKIIENMLING